MKTCKKCGLDKPLDSFTVDTRYKDGRYPWCAECRAGYRREKRHGSGREQTLEYFREWNDRNRDRVRELNNENYARHRDEYSEKRRASDTQRWHNDPAHRERKRKQDKERYQTNPDMRRRKIDRSIITTHARRARVRGMDTRYTQAEWRELCDRYDHRCLCCGRQEPEIQLTPDHVRPLSRGGSNSIDNLQPLCLDCNLEKNARTIDYRPEWDG